MPRRILEDPGGSKEAGRDAAHNQGYYGERNMVGIRALKSVAIAALAAGLGGIGSCVSAPPAVAPPPKAFRIVYGANRHGESDPCGCMVNQLGGLDRLVNLLAAEDKALVGPRFFVDAGDAFFAAPQIPPSRRAAAVSKARLIGEAYRLVRVDALNPGPRDLSAGLDLLRELERVSGAAFVSANLVSAEGVPLFKPWTVLDRGGVRIGVTGIAHPEAIPADSGVRALAWQEPLAKAIAELRERRVDATVVLSGLGLAEDRRLEGVAGVALVVGSRSLDVLEQPVALGQTWIVQPQIQGQTVGVIDFPASERVGRLHRMVDLGKDWDGKNAVSELMARHRDSVREIALRESESSTPAPGATAAAPFVAQPHACRNCHRRQVDFWETTPHASAYLVLYAKKQHFDPECIGCHSLGFQEPGGFEAAGGGIILDGTAPKGRARRLETLFAKVFAGSPGPLDSREQPARYAKLKKRYHAELGRLYQAGKIEKLYLGVQCEHCHGNRDGHPGGGSPAKVAEASCRKCHVPPHDNKFDFRAKVAKAGCPLSSEPAP